MNEIIKSVETLLQAYGIEDPDRVANDISAALPWRYVEGTEFYDDLYDLMNIALELKCPSIKCVVGKEIVDESFKTVFIEGIKGHLKKEFGKNESKNYKYLYNYIEESGFSKGWDDEKAQILFAMEDRVESRLDRIGQTYDDVSEKDQSSVS